MPDEVIQESSEPPRLLVFARWLESIGSSRTTGYRHRQRGLIKTVNVFGRLYISHQDAKQFETRAANGEFAMSIKTPQRRVCAKA